MENHEYARTMQEEMIREIERAEPTVLVFVGVPTSWLRKPNSRMDIFTWFGEYRRRYYQRVGVVDIIPRKDAIYKWNGEAQQYTPVSSSYVEVLRRINPSVQDP
jgi:hypothetical protein